MCEFCTNHKYGYTIVEKSEEAPVYLGSAEIRVIGTDKIYAAPDLIYHYVTEHQYLPPQEFIDAVLNSPLPTSRKYKELFKDLM